VGPLRDFLDDMATRLESEKSFSENKVLLLADSNDAYKGLAKLTPLFKALSEHRCLELVYKGFEDLESKVVKVHPLLLKQFNQRWFLFTYHADAPGKVEIYPVDRIQQHRALDETFRYPSDFDSSDYFEYLIGVTLLENTVLEQIHIKVKLPRAHYIETKPLCLHQKVVQKSESYIEFLLKLYPNKEMFAKFLEFGPDLEVVSPASIRDEMRNLANRMSELYK
jgi:predicted DNA-binding transcriptional regulator YafY